MQLIEVTDAKTRKEFLKVPWLIYKNDPSWIPALKQDVEAIFDPNKNKLHRKGEICRWVLKDDQGTLLGRIAAFIHPKDKLHRYSFGYFECVNNEEAAFMLFDCAKAWLAERGADRMDGPINFGDRDKFWGLIIKNFEEPPYYGQNYNPEYYVDFFRNYGLQQYYEQFIYGRDMQGALQDHYKERSDRISRDPRYEMRHIDKRNLEKFAEDFQKVYNAAWGKRDGDNFKGMPLAQAKLIVKKLKPIMDPNLIWFAYYDNEPIGFYITIPELNFYFKHVKGNLNWWGKVVFMWHKLTKTCTTSFAIVFGIHPDFQGKGVEGAIFNAYGKKIQSQNNKKKYQKVIITWLGSFNPKMISIVESLEADNFRTLATFRKLFDENAPFERARTV